jgi:hypothetical protein
MKLTQALQDTVFLMEGGQVAKTRRPGERFDAPGKYLKVKRAQQFNLLWPVLLLVGLLNSYR